MTNNTSNATPTTDGNWRAPSGDIFTTPDNKLPTHGTTIGIIDGSGGKASGQWLDGNVVKDKKG